VDKQGQMTEGFALEGRVQLLFAALLHDIGKAVTSEVGKTGRLIHPKHEVLSADMAEVFLGRIGAPGWVGENVIPMVREHMFRRGRSTDTISKRAIRRLSVRLDPVTIKELVDLIDADTMDRTTDDGFTAAMLEIAHEVQAADRMPEKILKGEDLIKKELTPGPLFGVILRAAYEAQLDGEFETHYGALAWMEEYLNEHIENL
jgi:tRNA nucleotidyltransferase (CCA-adding enzyme)